MVGDKGLARIAGTLEVHAPSIMLGAGRRDDVPAGKLNGLILDRLENPVRQPSRLRPACASVRRCHYRASPHAGTGTDLVKQQQRTARRLTQNGIPGRIAIRRRFDSVPATSTGAVHAPSSKRETHTYVPVSLPRPAKPCADQRAFRLHDRRSVTRRKRSRCIDELRFQDSRLLRVQHRCATKYRD